MGVCVSDLLQLIQIFKIGCSKSAVEARQVSEEPQKFDILPAS